MKEVAWFLYLAFLVVATIGICSAAGHPAVILAVVAGDIGSFFLMLYLTEEEKKDEFEAALWSLLAFIVIAVLALIIILIIMALVTAVVYLTGFLLVVLLVVGVIWLLSRLSSRSEKSEYEKIMDIKGEVYRKKK